MIDELEGDPRWWGGRIPDNLVLNEFHPEQLSKWKRKRLEPLLRKLLFPVCWSLLLLGIGILFSLLNYKTNFPRSLGLIILILGPFSLGFSILYISNKHENSKPIHVLLSLFGRSRILWFTIIIFILITSIIQKPNNAIFWNLAILPSVILWIEWLAFGSYYFSSPSAIWIMKYNSEIDLPMNELKSKGWDWQSDSLKPRNEPFAIKSKEGNILELSSITLGDEKNLVISWWQKGCIRSDPFVTKKMKALAIPGLTNKLGYSTSDFDLEMLDGIGFLDEYCIN